MNTHILLQRAKLVVSNNSPTILAGFGIAGVVTTTYLTARATFQAAKKISDSDLDENLAPKEKMIASAKLVWINYLPPAASAGVTIAAIAFSNKISTGRTAALAAAYTISERAYEEYKEKVADKLGKGKHQSILDELASDKVNRASGFDLIQPGEGDVLCFEAYAGRPFSSNMEKIKKAQNDINYKINHNLYATLSDFYDKLDLPHTSFSDDVGWNSQHNLELTFTSVLYNDKPVLSFDFDVAPSKFFLTAH